MQGFEAKKKKILVYLSILRITTFHPFALPAGVEPECDGFNLSPVTITLHSLYHPVGKMSYLNPMYEKGNVSIREEKNTANVPFPKSLRI